MNLIRIMMANLWTVARPTLAIVLFLVIIRTLFFRESIPNKWIFVSAVLLTMLGLYLFLAGISTSLIPLSRDTAYSLLATRSKTLIVLFACALGYFATLIEPGLRTLAAQVEEVAVGAITKTRIVQAAAVGFACGAGVGTLRILFSIPMKPLAVTCLLLLAGLVLMASDAVIAIAFDAASATTGPANIPILLGLTIGLSQATEGIDPIRFGFGLIALTAYGTTAAILLLGIVGGR